MLRKALRGIAVGLILMPEPVTTAIGLVLLGVAFLLSRSRILSSKPYLRGLIKFYLKQARVHSQPAKIVHHSLTERLAAYDAAWQRPPEKKVTHHVIDDQRLQRRFAARLEKVNLAVNNLKDGKTTTKGDAIHHSLSSRWASYEWPHETVASSDLSQPKAEKTLPIPYPYRQPIAPQKGGPPQTADKVIFHNLRSNLSGYVLPSVPLTPERTVAHTIDMVKLQRYYGRVLEERESERLAAEGKQPKPERIILRRYKETPTQPRAAERTGASTLRTQPAFS